MICSACDGVERPVLVNAALPRGPEYERQARLFIGDNHKFYQAKWARMDARRTSISWNWAAFLLFLFWIGYRRMYGVGIMLIAIDAIEFGLEEAFRWPALVSGLFNFGFGLAIGLNGNHWYRNHMERKIVIGPH